MFTNQRNQNSLFCPGNHFHALYVKFSDRTEKCFIVQQCDSRVSKDQRRFCGRSERLQYRLQTENESALFPPSLRENTARPTSCLTVSHTQTFIHLCNHMRVHNWPQGSGHSTKANHLLHQIRNQSKYVSSLARTQSLQRDRYYRRYKKKQLKKKQQQNITQKTVNTNANTSTLLCCGLFLGSVFIYFH